MEIEKVKDYSKINMVITIMDIGKIIRNMEKESNNFLPVKNLKLNGIKIENMVLEPIKKVKQH